MTLLRPGMTARYKLPDGSTYELDVTPQPIVDEEPVRAQPDPDPATDEIAPHPEGQ